MSRAARVVVTTLPFRAMTINIPGVLAVGKCEFGMLARHDAQRALRFAQCGGGSAMQA
jgi:hypothetical protein